MEPLNPQRQEAPLRRLMGPGPLEQSFDLSAFLTMSFELSASFFQYPITPILQLFPILSSHETNLPCAGFRTARCRRLWKDSTTEFGL